jgi:phosphotransferase system HPr-like phosphotransfer protein
MVAAEVRAMRVQLRGEFNREERLSGEVAQNLRRALASLLADVQIQANGRTADARSPLQMLQLQLHRLDAMVIIAEGYDAAAAANMALFVLGTPQK